MNHISLKDTMRQKLDCHMVSDCCPGLSRQGVLPCPLESERGCQDQPTTCGNLNALERMGGWRCFFAQPFVFDLPVQADHLSPWPPKAAAFVDAVVLMLRLVDIYRPWREWENVVAFLSGHLS